MRARDGRWLAMNLARRSDVDLLAAWMRRDWEGPPWDAVPRALEGMTADDAVERAQLLGIPAAVAVSPTTDPRAVTVTEGTTPQGTRHVVDLSALWAGPLCARLLGTRGVPVVKVEHVGRPDGARAGAPEFWDRLNGQKHEVTLDFASGSGRAALDALLDEASVVVTSARPRAIDQLGLGLRERVDRAGLVWVSITGYGRETKWRDRVAFGDDAAVAGGLAVAAGAEDAPVFAGDAPADPLAGLTGALAAASALEERRGAVIDVSMRDVVAMALAAGRYPAGMRQEVA